MDDVASFVLAIVRDGSVRNEIIDVGGPTETSFVDFASRVQRIRRLPEKRRHVPVPVLGLARHVTRPFKRGGRRALRR
jgi:nucleoside-diphosphate-sugar epimerase